MIVNPSQKEPKLKKSKILLVDDLKENLIALEGILRRDDIEIFKAKAGTEALEFMMLHEFALALIDVKMPGMSGFELAELMRGAKKTKNIPIIFVTATASNQRFSFKGYESGAVDFLLKPLDTHAVKSKVNIFIELHQQKKQLNNQLETITRNQIEQEELLTKLQITQGELEQAVQVRDEFIATLSHELRTPLTSILSWSQLIQKLNFDPENLKHGIKMIEQSAKMQAQLIDDLLDVARIQSGKLSINFTEVNPSEPVNLSIEAIRALANSKQILIESEIKIQTEKVWGDSERLQQIVWNLLTNAIKFSPTGGVIRVRVEPLEEHGDPFVSIKVIDQGKGVSPEFLPKLFERFSQADSSSVRVHRGLGLGLAIVRDLVQLLGGRVRAESGGLGKGATFTLLFPIKSERLGLAGPTNESPTPADSFLHPRTQEANEPVDLAGLCVMLVEDDPSALEVLSKALNSFGARTLPCSSAAEALAAFVKFKPDVLVSDISMPGEDGYSLIKKIRKLGPEHCSGVPSLALTAYATAGDVKRALICGFDSHMAKPFDTLRLGQVVAELARNGKQLPS
jgi:signal transduction histidine kinase